MRIMKKIYYLFMSMTVILLAACSQDEMEQVKEGTLPELRVMVNHPSSIATRASIDTTSTSFENGDTIGIFVVGPDGNPMNKNVAYVYNGTKWILANKSDKVYYSSDFSYYAYYPYVVKEDEDVWYSLVTFYMDAPTEFFKDFISSWEPLLDQSTLKNFNHSDLMIGKGTNLNETASVSFTLEHQMGLVRLSYFNWDTDSVVKDISGMDSKRYFYDENDEDRDCPIPYNTGKYFFHYIAKPGTTFEFVCSGPLGFDAYSVPVDASEGFITYYTIVPTN